MSTLNPGQVSGSSWGAYAGNVAARRLVWEVRGPHQAQGVVRMVAGLRPLADGTTGLYLAHPSTWGTFDDVFESTAFHQEDMKVCDVYTLQPLMDLMRSLPQMEMG